MADTEEKTYTTRQFAYKFDFYTGDVQKFCHSGDIKATKDDKGRWRIPESEVARITEMLSKEDKPEEDSA